MKNLLTTHALVLLAAVAYAQSPDPVPVPDEDAESWTHEHEDGPYRASTRDRPGTFITPGPGGDIETIHFAFLTEVKMTAETAAEAEEMFGEKWENTQEFLLRMRTTICQMRGDTVIETECGVTVGAGGFSEWTPIPNTVNRWRRQVNGHIEIVRNVGPPQA